jgi:hypothetical protein
MTYLLFAVALSLSAIAAYYAVMGLVAIFAAAVVPIAIMGSLLELSKLTVASWLYQNWKEIPTLLKSYFTIALVVLMLLTSMGIFGFLSKAHLDQAIPSGEVQSKLSILDEKIKTEKENLNASRQELNQLDLQVNETISRSGGTANTASGAGSNGVERSIAIRKSQQKDRARILKEIGDSQTKIGKLQEERSPIASEVRKVEAEVGPIKYIAALLYGDNPETDVLEKAVRWVIIMIVMVFDPLAVLMLVAANWNLKHNNESHWTEYFKKKPEEDFPDIKAEEELQPVEPEPVIEPPDTSAFDHMVDDLTKQVEPVVEVVEETPQTETKDSPFEDDLPEIEVDEASKDWEPELYKRRETGRYMSETGQKPPKTTSFLNKISSIFGEKTIEKEVDELQEKKDSYTR